MLVPEDGVVVAAVDAVVALLVVSLGEALAALEALEDLLEPHPAASRAEMPSTAIRPVAGVFIGKLLRSLASYRPRTRRSRGQDAAGRDPFPLVS
jgi:hypothetical protein